MPDLPQIVSMIDVIGLPLLGLLSLLWSKVGSGDGTRIAERQFIVSLVVITIVTLRTVINSDDVWLVHMMTLATMIVGTFTIPNQDASVAL